MESNSTKMRANVLMNYDVSIKQQLINQNFANPCPCPGCSQVCLLRPYRKKRSSDELPKTKFLEFREQKNYEFDARF